MVVSLLDISTKGLLSITFDILGYMIELIFLTIMKSMTYVKFPMKICIPLIFPVKLLTPLFEFSLGFLHMHMSNVAWYLEILVVTFQNNSLLFLTTSGSSLRESSFFWTISINITSPSSPLVQTSLVLDDWATNPSDSKNELSLRTFSVMNETDGSGGVEGLTWIFSGLSLRLLSPSLMTVVEGPFRDLNLYVDTVSPKSFSRSLKYTTYLLLSSVASEQDELPSSVGFDFRARLDGGWMYSTQWKNILASVEKGPLVWLTITEQQPKFSQPDSGLVVLVFQKGDDPIDAINHMMSFLTAVVTTRYPTNTNNQLRTSLNPRQQATIYDGKVVKERTHCHKKAITEGTWGFEHTKACFRDEIIPFIKELKDIFNNFNQYLVEELADVQKVFYQMEQAVEQHRLESRTFEVKMNQVLSENERLLAQAIDNDIVKTVVNLSVNDGGETSFNKPLEKHCITLEADSQLNQEIFQQENSVLNQNAPSFTQLFELSELRAQSQAKDTVIVKLKEQIKSLNGNVDESTVKMDMDEIETLNIELEHRVTKLVAENEHLKQTYKQLL
ncbi:hypothetical protein Tco_0432987 [Tanacetum coccineum]